MSDFKEKLKTRTDRLKVTVDGILGNQEAQGADAFKMPEEAGYSTRTRSREVKAQEEFRRKYKAKHKAALDGVEIGVQAPAEYAPEDVAFQERKYGYFSHTKKQRIRNAKTQKNAWKGSLDEFESNDEYGFDVKDEMTEDTLDLMASTRRLAAIEDKKRDLVDEILTAESLKALKEKDVHAGNALETYKNAIIDLGPSIEVVPDDHEILSGELHFSEESVERFKAYLRFVASDPIGAMEAALTDSLHQVTSFPEKMLGVRAIPQSFDRLMQIRNRYVAINELRKLRLMPKDVKDDNPVGKLMTKLYPRVDKAAAHGAHKDQDHDHAHDEEANFDFIKNMETALNSDMSACLSKAGIRFRAGLFGSKREKNLIDSDGNAAKNGIALMKNKQKALSQDEKEEKRQLNSEHWESREKAAYDEVRKKLSEEEKPKPDAYGILKAVKKIQTEAAKKKKIRYNTAMAEELEKRIADLSLTIDELKNRVTYSATALELDQVKMSRELTERMRTEAERAQYDLFYLVERAQGYINAYDHMLRGSELNVHGSAIMDELKAQETDDGFVVIRDQVDTRYNTDTLNRVNSIAQPVERKKLTAKNDRETAEQVKALLIDFETRSTELMREIREINPAKKVAVIEKAMEFRKDFLSQGALLNKVTAGGCVGAVALIRSIEDTQTRDKALAAYQNTLNKTNYICTYVDLYRTENIQSMYTDHKLPKELVLIGEEKRMRPQDHAEKAKTLQQVLDNYQREILKYDAQLGRNAVKFDLAGLEPDEEAGEEQQAVNALAELLNHADLSKLSDQQYPEQPEEEIPILEVRNRLDSMEKPLEEGGNGGEDGDQPGTKKVWKRIEKRSVIHTKNGDIDNLEITYEETDVPLDYEETEDEKAERERIEKEREEERQRREEEEQRERERREHEQNGQPQYERRVKDELAMAVINEGSLKTTRDFVNYLRIQLTVINKNSHVTWDEVKKEAKSWLVGRELIQHGTNQKVAINAENVDELIEETRKTFDPDQIVDEANYTEEEKQTFADSEEEPVFVQGSVAALVQTAFSMNSKQNCGKFAESNTPDNAVEKELQKNFKLEYYRRFQNEISKETVNGRKVDVNDVSIPEEDQKAVRWLLSHMPQNVADSKAMSDYRKLWDKKIGYDMLRGKKLDARTFKKTKAFFDAWETARDLTKEAAEVKAIKDHLKTVDTNVRIPDMSVGHEKDIPNVMQWYGASCWATSGALIANWYMKHKQNDADPVVFDQMSFLDPTQVQLNPYSEDMLQAEQKDRHLDYGFSKELRNIRTFVKPMGGMGNLMSMPDVMLANMSNTGIRHMRFNIPDKDKSFDGQKMSDDEWTKLSQLFFNRISELLQGGSGPISLLVPGHYRTIIGFGDGKLRVRDSSSSSGCVNGNSEDTFTLEEFRDLLKDHYRTGQGFSCELVFLQKLDGEDKEQLSRKYGYRYENGKLVYDEKDEKIRASSPENMCHNLGLMYSNENVERNNLLDRFMKDEIYVPKNLDHVANVKEVNKSITETRRKLGLPDITQEEKANTDAQRIEFQLTADEIRAQKAEEWKNRAKFPDEIEAERQANERARELERQRQEELRRQQEEERKKQEEERKKQEAERKQREIESRARSVFGDKFDENKAELVRKTQNFDQFLRGGAKLKEKDKKAVPTALDVLNGDYEIRQAKLMNEEKDVEVQPFGWLLTNDDMARIEEQLQKNDSVFAHKAIESEESKVADRNAAMSAIKMNDISQFNHLPAFLKEYYGRKALDVFFKDIPKYKNDGMLPTLKELKPEGLRKLAAKTRDPIFRTAINMIITRKGKSARGRDQSKTAMEYDKFLNQTLIMQTLSPMTAEALDRLRNDSRGRKKHRLDGRNSADTMIANNMAKQRHLAKTMLLLQLGRFDRIDSRMDGNREIEETNPYDSTVSEALAHGGRVGISLPSGTKAQQQELRKAWEGDITPLLYTRMATHDLHRRKLNEEGSKFREVRLRGRFKNAVKYIFTFGRLKGTKPTSLINNHGLDLALGGLGRQFNGNKVIDDQGSFGHLYQKYVSGDENTCGGMLVGIENSAPGGTHFIQKQVGGYAGTSCIGEVHSTKAISHGQSAFFSTKKLTGDRYGGRVVDLSHVSADNLTAILNAFDRKYKELQTEATKTISNSLSQQAREEAQKKRADATAKLEKMNELLSGKIMSAQRLSDLLHYLGISRGRRTMVANMRSTEGLSRAEKNKYTESMRKANLKRNNMNAFFDDREYVNNDGDNDGQE